MSTFGHREEYIVDRRVGAIGVAEEQDIEARIDLDDDTLLEEEYPTAPSPAARWLGPQVGERPRGAPAGRERKEPRPRGTVRPEMEQQEPLIQEVVPPPSEKKPRTEGEEEVETPKAGGTLGASASRF